MSSFLYLLLSYIIGSIPFGLLLPIVLGKGDPRTIGSGNIGATNVYRLAGWHTAFLVYLCDVAKGAIPTWIAPSNQRPYVALACVIGHIFSIFLKGKGGKGVATACGVLLVLMPKAFVVGLVVWWCVWKTTHYVSLASLIGCSVILGMGWYQNMYRSFALFLLLILVWSHRGNIIRLIQGNESKVQKKKSKKNTINLS